jgi:hypothetical protein
VLETEYAPGAEAGKKTYQLIDLLLSDLLKPIGSGDVTRG